MKKRPKKHEPTDGLEIVKAVGLTLPDVEATTKYDESPVLKLDGCFMAGLATHPSAEPDTLVVRVGCEEREWLIADAPETRPPRLALRVMALNLAQGTNSQAIPTQR